MTADDADAIVTARAAYDALTPYALTLVDADKVTKLVNAEAAIGALVDQAKAQEVVALIEALTNDSTAEEIQGARTAYNKLTDEQKKLVTNLDKLATAEQRIVDKIAAEFKAKVDALGTPSFPRDNDVVAALNAEFDGLIEAVKEKLGETKETLNKYIESASHYERLTPTFSNVKMSALNGCDSYMIVFTNETGSDIEFTYAADVPGWTDSGEKYTLAKGTTLVVTIKKNFAEKGIYPYLDGQSKKMDEVEGLTVKVYGKKVVAGAEVVALSVNGTTDDPTYGKVLVTNVTNGYFEAWGYMKKEQLTALAKFDNVYFCIYNPSDVDVAFFFQEDDTWKAFDRTILKAGSWTKVSLSAVFGIPDGANGVYVDKSTEGITLDGWMISDFYGTAK